MKFITKFEFGQIFLCVLLKEAKKKSDTIQNGPTSIPKCVPSSVRITDPESNRYRNILDTSHILSHANVGYDITSYQGGRQGDAKVAWNVGAVIMFPTIQVVGPLGLKVLKLFFSRLAAEIIQQPGSFVPLAMFVGFSAEPKLIHSDCTKIKNLF